jgi:hypothetical protein
VLGEAIDSTLPCYGPLRCSVNEPDDRGPGT